MTAIGTQPSDRFDPAARERAGDRCVAALQDLLRIPSVNPPPAGGTGELDAARYLAGALEDAGIPSEVFEPVDGRGSVVARLRGDGTGGEPLLLLSHLDVVPAPPERWTHDPFGGEIADGYLYGRGAVDMKDLTAMELEVMRLLAAETRAAGRDPASDPVPGLTRDVLFASTADEEAGGLAGAGWLAMEHPEHLRAAAAINEAGGVSVEIGGRRLYPIQVAEKGYAVYRVTIRGTAGHASMPRTDNAAVLAAEAIRRLAEPLPARLVAPMDAFFEGAAAAIGGEIGDRIRAVAAGEPMPAGPAADRHCAPAYRRAAAALVRDTISPTIVHAGVKYNVIPGEATVEIDCRRLPGTTEEAMHAAVLERLGPDLAAVAEVELVVAADPVVAPAEGLFEILAASILAHDPEGVPLPILAPFATDAKHLLPLGVPSYGFSPLRQPADETYIDRYHGVDERVSVAGLRWGVPVLYDAVRTFCG